MENKKKKIVETEGKDIEEAVKKALKILKIERKDAKIKILSEENKGLFGMQGAKPAKVRVNIKEEK